MVVFSINNLELTKTRKDWPESFIQILHYTLKQSIQRVRKGNYSYAVQLINAVTILSKDCAWNERLDFAVGECVKIL